MAVNQRIQVVVAGEVDSGKSTLIGRLLFETGSLAEGLVDRIDRLCRELNRDFEFAYLLDSFEEERKDEFTLDTTQALCRSREGRELLFIDVPGHVELLRNMLSGASYADAAVLVVDFQKLEEEQTRRHAFLLSFLGIEQLIVVLNKMDGAGYGEERFAAAREAISRFLEAAGAAPTHVIPVSAKNGENLIEPSAHMPWYAGPTLLEALKSCRVEKARDEFRFALQDIYDFTGRKVAAGKILSGKVRKGEQVSILPLGATAKVSSIRVFEGERASAGAPESIGLVLEGERASAGAPESIGLMERLARGQVICREGLPEVTSQITAKLFCVRPIAVDEPLTFACATQELDAKITRIIGAWDSGQFAPREASSALGETDTAEVIVTTDAPAVVERRRGGDSLGRFVLKSNHEICAIGVVV